MTNLKKTQQISQKISNGEDFLKAMKQEAEKSGILDKLKKTLSPPTKKFTAVLRPFARRHQKFYVPLILSAEEALKRVKAFYGIGKK